MSFEQRLLRALREELAKPGYNMTLQLMRHVVEKAAEARPAETTTDHAKTFQDTEEFQQRYDFTQLGWCPYCGFFTHKDGGRHQDLCLKKPLVYAPTPPTAVKGVVGVTGVTGDTDPTARRSTDKIPEAVCLRCHKPVKDHNLTIAGVTCPETYSPGWRPDSGVTDTMRGHSFHYPVTVSFERFNRLLDWERWARYTATMALNWLRANLAAANALAIRPQDPPEKL